MRQVDHAHVRRLVFSVLLRGFCLPALLAVLGVGAWAAPLQGACTGLNPEIMVSKPGNDAGRSSATRAVDNAVYLPIVGRNSRQFTNGDFEHELRGWDTGRGPFREHGSGLPQSAVVWEGGYRALLGIEGSLPTSSVPVGYGTIAQTFALDKRFVRLQYWVESYDKAKGAQRYYDSFEVSVNRPPHQISDSERDSRGCASTALNPEGTLTVSGDGLVFCGGRPGTSGVGTLWDTQGWNTVTLDLSAFRGTNVTLYFTVWSREYDPSAHDDRGWFNTWAYVDNVQLADDL